MVPREEVVSKQPQKADNFFSIFIPKKGFFITPILIDLNILIFILMAINGADIVLPDNESLLKWGANFRPLTMEGEWWRLLTCCFVHIGIIHLLLNMYALLYIGVLLEPFLGRARFLTAYLLTGIAASVTSLWWHDFSISAGASGAVFGMYGVFLAMLTTNLIDKSTRKALLTSIMVFVGYNLINGMKGGIDNAAHIGGLLSGLLIGYAFIPGLRRPGVTRLKYGTIVILTGLVLAGSFVVSKKLPRDLATYEEKMNEFVTLETMAMSVFNMPESATKDQLLYEINERGIYFWKESIKLIGDLEKLSLPGAVEKRNAILKDYCELRIKSYELMSRAISEDTDQYNDQIGEYNREIDLKIKALGE